MTFLQSDDLAKASVEDVCDEGESINCFFRWHDGRELFVDTNWENLNAPMHRDFSEPEFQSTLRGLSYISESTRCQEQTDEGLDSQSELSHGLQASSAAVPDSPAASACDSFDEVCDSPAEVVSSQNRHAFTPSYVNSLAQQHLNPVTPKGTKALRAPCGETQSFLPPNMQARPSMPAIDHSLPEQVAQEWSEASLNAITPGLQELPPDTTQRSPQSARMFCASRLAEVHSHKSSRPAEAHSHKSSAATSSRPATSKPHIKILAHQMQQPSSKPRVPIAMKPSKLRGPSPLGAVPLQPHRASPRPPGDGAQNDDLHSHAISLSQSISNASTAPGHSNECGVVLSELTATISGGIIPVPVAPDSDCHSSGKPCSAKTARSACGTGGPSSRSRSVTAKATPSSTGTVKSTTTPSSARAAPTQGATTHSLHACGATGGSKDVPQAKATPLLVPSIDVSKTPADSGSDVRTDTPSPSGLSVAQKIKWHEAVVSVPEADSATGHSAATGSGHAKLKRSQSARPAVEVPKYVRCAATAAPRCRPDKLSTAVASYPLSQPMSRTRSQPAPRRHMYKPQPGKPHGTPEGRGEPSKPYAVVTPRERPPPPVHTAPVSACMHAEGRAAGTHAAHRHKSRSDGRKLLTAPSSSREDTGESPDVAPEGMPVIDEVEDVLVAPVAIAPLPKLGQPGRHSVASRAAQFERVAVEGHGKTPEAGAKAQIGRVAKLTSSAGRSVTNAFRKLTRASVPTEGWGRSWRLGGSARSGTPSSVDAGRTAASASLGPLGSVCDSASADGDTSRMQMRANDSALSMESHQSGPEAVSARHSSDEHESEPESACSSRVAQPLAHVSFDGPITLQSLHGVPKKEDGLVGAGKVAAAARSNALAAAVQAASQKVFDSAANSRAAAADKGPRTVAVVERGVQREVKSSQSRRPGGTGGKAAPEPERGPRSVRGAPTPSETVPATPRAAAGGQLRAVRTRSGPPASPAVALAERARRKPAAEEPPRPRASTESVRPRVSSDSSRHRISTERSSDTVASSYCKKAIPEGIANSVNRLTQRKQHTSMTSEQRQLQEIERHRAAAALERTRSNDYWQRTKRAGGAAVTPPNGAGAPRTFLHKPEGPPAEPSVHQSTDAGCGRAAAGSIHHRTVRPRSTSGTREPRNPRLAVGSPQITAAPAAPRSTALSPFGTTTPPMHAPASVHSANGGSATFAGYLDSDVSALHDGTDGARSAVPSSPMQQWQSVTRAGILPMPQSPGQTPLLWNACHAPTAVASLDDPGVVEVHLESTRTQGIRLSSGPARRGSNSSDEVSASLTPRVPSGVARSRAQQQRPGVLDIGARGALFACGDSGASGASAGGLEEVEAVAGVLKRVSDVEAGRRDDSMESTATALQVPGQAGSPLQHRGAAGRHASAAQGQRSKQASGSSRGNPPKARMVAPQHESHATPASMRRVQSARPHQTDRSAAPPPASRARSARPGVTPAAPPASTGQPAAAAATPAVAPPSSQQRSPAPRTAQSRYGIVQAPKPVGPSSNGPRRQPAAVHGPSAPASTRPAAPSLGSRHYGGVRPKSAAPARVAPAGSPASFGGSRQSPMSRSCEPAAWRSLQTSSNIPSALRRDPAEERKRTRDRVGKSAVEPYRPLRNMQPWAARALDGAAAAILNQSARGQQDRQMHYVGTAQQPAMMRTHVPVAKPVPTRPVSPALATAKRSQHAQRQPGASGDNGSGSRPRSAAPAPRGSAASSQAASSQPGSGRSLQRTAVAAFNAGMPRVARQFAARRGDNAQGAAGRGTSTGAGAGPTGKRPVTSRPTGPRSAAAVMGSGTAKPESSAAGPGGSGRGQDAPRMAAAADSRSRSRSAKAAPAPAPLAHLTQEPLKTPVVANEPKPEIPALHSRSTGHDSSTDAATAQAAVPPPERLSAASSHARELCSVLSDGSLGPVTGAIRGPSDMSHGQAPPPISTGSGQVQTKALVAPDSCVSEVAPEVLETIASMAAPAELEAAEQAARAASGSAPEAVRCDEPESFLQGTSFILNTEVVAAHASSVVASGLKAGRGGVVDAIVSDSGRIVVEDVQSRTGTVSCHDSGTGALNRAAAAAAGVAWTGPPPLTARRGAASPPLGPPAGVSAAVLEAASSPEGFNSSPAIVAIGGVASRRERSARLSAALPSRLSLGPGSKAATSATAAGTERLQGVLARRRQSKLLRRQSSSGALSASLELAQRSKSRRMSVEPLGQLQLSQGQHTTCVGLSASASVGGMPTVTSRRPGIPEDLVDCNANVENIPQVV